MRSKKIDRFVRYWSNPYYDLIYDLGGKSPYDLYIQLLEDESKRKKRKNKYE